MVGDHEPFDVKSIRYERGGAVTGPRRGSLVVARVRVPALLGKYHYSGHIKFVCYLRDTTFYSR